MGKYQPLSDFLKGFAGDSWEATFPEIEEILQFALPPSAHRHDAWWANASRGSHSQARSWIDAGWSTVPSEIQRSKGRVRFVRQRAARRQQASRDLEGLRKDAMRVTGIEDLNVLEKEALSALVQREAGRMLVRLGGTMPELAVPERERPA